MLYGVAAFRETGMPVRHANAVQEVADRTGHAILFRAVGKHATRLLEEGYAAKGFRIDTKSCDWGPMRGFVCVDHRLSKVGGDPDKAGKNKTYTVDALYGRVRHDALGGLSDDLAHDPSATMPDWQAGCKPIVISADRYTELVNGGLAGASNSAGIVKGVSRDVTNRVALPWALIPIARCMQVRSFADACGPAPAGSFGVFVDYSNASFPFEQWVPDTVARVKVLGYDAVLGLINPGSESYGYRACVTGDYDLFAVWAPLHKLDPFAARNQWDKRVVDMVKEASPRLRTPHFHQHYKLGNITARLNMMKVLLNTAFIANGGFTGGNLVHHSDEVGNPSPDLKKTIVESFPILAFVPQASWRSGSMRSPGACLRDVTDFRNLANICRAGGIIPDIMPEWGVDASGPIGVPSGFRR
ncbi:MAG TPA: anthrax toxin-like adenylyl cyclase domain-containing protein [Gemmatimonadaceae bacterium]|jgi:hypothetical protein